jgi:hypothetical protein
MLNRAGVIPRGPGMLVCQPGCLHRARRHRRQYDARPSRREPEGEQREPAETAQRGQHVAKSLMPARGEATGVMSGFDCNETRS